MNDILSATGHREFKTVHFCGGIGGCTLGMQQAAEEYKGVTGTFRTLFSVDVDTGACDAYEKLTGSRSINRDMFDREQYVLFHGKEPPTEWREIQPEELRDWACGEYPDVIFISAPCKGFSRLLPNATAQKPKYKALNKLAFRAITLAMEAWGDDPPAVILFENVPGIETRGAELLASIRSVLRLYGYVFHEGHHDCGEIGNLGQKRVRYLMIARNPKKLPSFIYQPPKLGLRTIGDVLGPLPLPGDTEHGGRMHRMPRLAWRTWERLALIPAGKDWRALRDLSYTPQSGTMRIVPWDAAGNTVTGAANRPSNASCINVADPRHYNNILKVCAYDAPGAAITSGSGVMSGGLSVADPRELWRGCYKVVPWDVPSPTVTAQTGTPKSNSGISVADPHFSHPTWNRTSVGKIAPWDELTGAIIAKPNISGAGAASVADPRISEKWSGAGNYKIMVWDKPANAVTASGDIHAGAAAVADPRIPDPNERGVFIIIAADDSWHRPITTFEMAMLQGFPAVVDGKPFDLPGDSDAKWREWIGNAVPVQAAWAMGSALLKTMLPNYQDDWHWDCEGNDIWVQPAQPRRLRE